MQVRWAPLPLSDLDGVIDWVDQSIRVHIGDWHFFLDHDRHFLSSSSATIHHSHLGIFLGWAFSVLFIRNAARLRSI